MTGGKEVIWLITGEEVIWLMIVGKEINHLVDDWREKGSSG